MRKKDERSFTLDQDNLESPVFIIQEDGFGVTGKFTEITSVDIEIHLGATADLLVQNSNLDVTKTDTSSEAWDVDTQMRYFKVVCSSANDFSGDFNVSGVEL